MSRYVKIFEEVLPYLNTPGISTMTIISSANAQGIPVYGITSANQSSILPQLQVSEGIKQNITNYINAGYN